MEMGNMPKRQQLDHRKKQQQKVVHLRLLSLFLHVLYTITLNVIKNRLVPVNIL